MFIFRLTAKTFLHAAHYFEVLNHFGPLDVTTKTNIQFARTKGTEIMQNISNTPPSPKLNDSTLEEENHALAERFYSSETSKMDSDLPSYDDLSGKIAIKV